MSTRRLALLIAVLTGLFVVGVALGVGGLLALGDPGVLVVGLVAVGLAALSLIMDFDAIERGVRQGAPARFAWSAAFGLIVTLVWLYLELLRLLAMFNRN